MAELEIPKGTIKILSDITGEPRLDVAIRMTLRDMIEHRLEKIEKELKELEKKYGANFSEFERNWKGGKIKNKFSYIVEKDYLEWDSLITRKKKLEQASKWLN